MVKNYVHYTILASFWWWKTMILVGLSHSYVHCTILASYNDCLIYVYGNWIIFIHNSNQSSKYTLVD